ncbi:MAG: hypothetical protein JST14_13170 [Bacteroidetes bacterium]|nr:hypothetical protein [Bacteroidota bacterium]MBS1977455.1 hypothetical protein [Bacteroidota bacterium]
MCISKDSRTLHLMIRALLVGCLLFQNFEEMMGYSTPSYGVSEDKAELHFSLRTTNQTPLYEEKSTEDCIQRAIGTLVCHVVYEPEDTYAVVQPVNCCFRTSWQPARYDLFLQNRRLLI